MRIQKYLANLGVASRRQIERLIQAGDITVNGQLATLGQSVRGDECICVNGQVIHALPVKRKQVIMLNKPLDDWCTRIHSCDKPSVFKRLPSLDAGRWVSVGRLDVKTTGLLLFTNQGEWAHQLMHPSFSHQRTYLVTLNKPITSKHKQQLLAGLMLDDGMAKVVQVTQCSQYTCEMIMQEGRWRIVRRLWQALGMTVKTLHRINYAGIALPDTLQSGQYQNVPLEQLPIDLLS